MSSDRPQGYAGQRPSKSADTSRQREIDRLRALTPRERILIALELRQRGRLIADIAAGAKRVR